MAVYSLFHSNSAETETVCWFYMKSLLADFKDLMFFDCHKLDDLFMPADLTFTAVPVDCGGPDQAQL